MLEILPIILFPYARWLCLLFFSSSPIILNYAHKKIRKHLIFYCIVFQRILLASETALF